MAVERLRPRLLNISVTRFLSSELTLTEIEILLFSVLSIIDHLICIVVL